MLRSLEAAAATSQTWQTPAGGVWKVKPGEVELLHSDQVRNDWMRPSHGAPPPPTPHKPFHEISDLKKSEVISLVMMTQCENKIAETRQTTTVVGSKPSALPPSPSLTHKNHPLFRLTETSWDSFLTLSHTHKVNISS